MFSENQEFINKYMLQIWNRKDMSIIYETFAEDALIHSPMGESIGPKAMEEALHQWHTAFPDIRIQLLEIMESGSKVMVHWSSKGTHKGPFLGIEATQQPFKCSGMSMYRIHRGKIVEYWAYINTHQIVQQLSNAEADYSAHLAPL